MAGIPHACLLAESPCTQPLTCGGLRFNSDAQTTPLLFGLYFQGNFFRPFSAPVPTGPTGAVQPFCSVRKMVHQRDFTAL